MAVAERVVRIEVDGAVVVVEVAVVAPALVVRATEGAAMVGAGGVAGTAATLETGFVVAVLLAVVVVVDVAEGAVEPLVSRRAMARSVAREMLGFRDRVVVLWLEALVTDEGVAVVRLPLEDDGTTGVIAVDVGAVAALEVERAGVLVVAVAEFERAGLLEVRAPDELARRTDD